VGKINQGNPRIIRAFAKSGTGTLNDLTWLEEVGAGVAVIGGTGSAPGVPTGHRIPAQGNALGTVTVFPGVLKERRIFVNRGRLPNPGRCGVPSERLIGGASATQGCTLGWYAPPLQGGS